MKKKWIILLVVAAVVVLLYFVGTRASGSTSRPRRDLTPADAALNIPPPPSSSGQEVLPPPATNPMTPPAVSQADPGDWTTAPTALSYAQWRSLYPNLDYPGHI